MTLVRRGLILATVQCLLVLSLAGKLVYDRSRLPRVWVKAATFDRNLPLRGRYLSLRLTPERDAHWFRETDGATVQFYVPEGAALFERSQGEVWAEVTIPRKGPPRPIRLAMKKDGRLEPIPAH
jgi:hypothetical protein